ncbi:hypothetical protein HaLaN_06585 [Haematococcus lacustris]|uniref:Uncharacterized protein n=1 Tax=Haematococcus lacustris TaxID=44745 RepID=A0A699YX73_HAELA|nr:hypothetical protein HaLaN_06585 [Haematococcus lacustris]
MQPHCMSLGAIAQAVGGHNNPGHVKLAFNYFITCQSSWAHASHCRSLAATAMAEMPAMTQTSCHATLAMGGQRAPHTHSTKPCRDSLLCHPLCPLQHT